MLAQVGRHDEALDAADLGDAIDQADAALSADGGKCESDAAPCEQGSSCVVQSDLA